MGHARDQRGFHSALDKLATTKLSPQTRDEGHVVRQDLAGALDKVLQCRLAVVHAGAGYGKTSLLMQWLKTLRHQGVAAAWLTLEEDEGAPSVCLAHMFAALVRLGYIDPDPLAELGNLDEKMPVKSLAAAFINILNEKTEPLVVFLDEFNRAQTEDLCALFRILMRNLPRHVHFVVASRHRPEIDLENLRARDELLEISASELRFSKAEVAAFLASSGAQVNSQELHRLTDRTEGWPIALQMARLWLSGDGEKARLVSDFSGRTTDLTRYLTEQVLSALPDDVQDFLMQTSILDRLNGDAANAVTERRDGWQMLEHLYEHDLFLIPETEDGQWYRYHTLFLDFLRDRLQRYDADVIVNLHRRAADWMAGQGLTKQAINHAQKTGDHHLAARLLSEAGNWRLIMDGHIGLIRTAIAGLPENIIRAYLPLFLAKTFLLVKDGDIYGASMYFASVDKDPNWTVQEEIDYDVVEHILLDYADQPATIADVERLKSLQLKIQKNDHVMHAILADSLAAKFYEFGLFQQSLKACEDASARYRIMRSLYGEVFIRFIIAKSHLAQGRLDEAEHILLATEQELDARFGEGIDLGAQTSVYLAEVFVERGHMADGAARLHEALPIVEQSDGWYELYAAAYSAAAAIEWSTRGAQAALTVLDQARDVARIRRLDRLSLLADCQSVYYLFLGGRLSQLSEPEIKVYGDQLAAFVVQAAGPPPHRLVGMAAACLAMIDIARGAYHDALTLLESHARTAEDSGDIRQLVLLTLLISDAHATAGHMEAAVRALDKAVRYGLFSGIRRPYLDLGRRLKPVIDVMLAGHGAVSSDRYRNNFLRDLQRDVRRTEKRQGDDGPLLTLAAVEVLRELSRGLSNKEIALELDISPNTVKFRVKSLFAKLGVSNRADAARIYRERTFSSTPSSDSAMK